MKAFISTPMQGKTEQQILEERESLIAYIKNTHPEAEILDSYFADYTPSSGNVGLKYLAKSLEVLADATDAYFDEGWENARGCKIENECAIAYGITVHELYFPLAKGGQK